MAYLSHFQGHRVGASDCFSFMDRFSSFVAACWRVKAGVALSLKTSHRDVFASLRSAQSPSSPYPPIGASDCFGFMDRFSSFVAACVKLWLCVALSRKTVHRTVFFFARLQVPTRNPKQKRTSEEVLFVLVRVTATYGLKPELFAVWLHFWLQFLPILHFFTRFAGYWLSCIHRRRRGVRFGISRKRSSRCSA